MTTTTTATAAPISVAELRRRAGEYVNHVHYGGKSFTITMRGKGVAILVRLQEGEEVSETITIAQLRFRTGEYVNRVYYGGEKIAVTLRGKQAAVLSGVSEEGAASEGEDN